MSIRIKLILFISFLFIAAIGNAMLTIQLERYGEEKLFWVSHTNKVILEINELVGEIKDAETGQRGFLLTQNNSYLEPYYRGIIKAKNHFNSLMFLTSDNQLQQQRLYEINKLMKLKFDELAVTIQLTQDNNNNKALEIVAKGTGKQYMDDIRTLHDEFSNTEMVLLEERKGNYREYRGIITSAIIFEIIFFVFLAISTIIFLNKNLFAPLTLLLASTHKMQEGKRVDIAELSSQDEMGYLISSFFKMQDSVLERTEILHSKAIHDELTGLLNRTSVFDEIEKAIINTKELGTQSTLFFIDLNKFKQLNDTLGHAAGDAVLIETAKRLVSSVRTDDIVFRLAGDEFLVLIKNINNISEVQHIVSNILDTFKPSTMFQGKSIKISLSIGIAISPDNSENATELLNMADVAMYEAKHDKGSDYKFFDKSMLKRASD